MIVRYPIACCKDCGATSLVGRLYWHDVDGKPMQEPRCQYCHEQAVRRSTRGATDLPRAIDGYSQTTKPKNAGGRSNEPK